MWQAGMTSAGSPPAFTGAAAQQQRACAEVSPHPLGQLRCQCVPVQLQGHKHPETPTCDGAGQRQAQVLPQRSRERMVLDRPRHEAQSGLPHGRRCHRLHAAARRGDGHAEEGCGLLSASSGHDVLAKHTQGTRQGSTEDHTGPEGPHTSCWATDACKGKGAHSWGSCERGLRHAARSRAGRTPEERTDTQEASFGARQGSEGASVKKEGQKHRLRNTSH